jgi:hypothetical protein
MESLNVAEQPAEGDREPVLDIPAIDMTGQVSRTRRQSPRARRVGGRRAARTFPQVAGGKPEASRRDISERGRNGERRGIGVARRR